MLANLEALLNWAEEKNCALVAFNIYNAETVMAVVNAAVKSARPAVLAFGESYQSYVPMEALTVFIKTLIQGTSLPIALHLDHAKDFSTIMKAMACGFTSVMYDGSSLSLERNIENTRFITRMAHQLGICVEAELGYLNPEDGSQGLAQHIQDCYTRMEEAQQFIRETKADALAIAIGNAHGLYRSTPHLDFQRLKEIAAAAAVPIVLHGCSGIPDSMIQKAISLGVRKLNVNTELAISSVKSIEQMIGASDAPLRLEKVLGQAQATMEVVATTYLEAFTSVW